MGTDDFRKRLERDIARLVYWDVAIQVPRQVAVAVAAISEELGAEGKAAGKLELPFALVRSKDLSAEQARVALMTLFDEKAIFAREVNAALDLPGLACCIRLPSQV
jgi:hypothetical protein